MSLWTVVRKGLTFVERQQNVTMGYTFVDLCRPNAETKTSLYLTYTDTCRKGFSGSVAHHLPTLSQLPQAAWVILQLQRTKTRRRRQQASNRCQSREHTNAQLLQSRRHLQCTNLHCHPRQHTNTELLQSPYQPPPYKDASEAAICGHAEDGDRQIEDHDKALADINEVDGWQRIPLSKKNRPTKTDRVSQQLYTLQSKPLAKFQIGHIHDILLPQ
ncbi:hypothetical protein HPB48_001390 [Haemaphysalis longicornis]|uniref:Uncharacterized protein n=1 Tax=Haemaphysalis longicornis TaxID=44386 RepID=A0A9J6GXL5_HAELO|nr:hypothetical protein HPB48_001390 [Haemaphysalis longicornis]